MCEGKEKHILIVASQYFFPKVILFIFLSHLSSFMVVGGWGIELGFWGFGPVV